LLILKCHRSLIFKMEFHQSDINWWNLIGATISKKVIIELVFINIDHLYN
jgi:hypothetical protein